MPPPLPLTLIVALTPTSGIGLSGRLPWPTLSAEMRYFARVTRRAPAGQTNAVIMGRKTWASIPARFRPLKGRVNVVVTRSGEGVVAGEQGGEEVLVAPGMEEAVGQLRRRFAGVSGEEGRRAGGVSGEVKGEGLGRVFVIGGGEVYRAALELRQGGGREGWVDRMLVTRLKGEFECDTFFPLVLEGEAMEEKQEWTRASTEELEAWTGEEGLDGVKKEGDVEYEFRMYTRSGAEASALR